MTDDKKLNEQARRVKEILEQTKSIRIEAPPKFNQRVIARFRFLGSEKKNLAYWLGLPAIRWLVLPAFAGSSIYYGAQYVQHRAQTSNKPDTQASLVPGVDLGPNSAPSNLISTPSPSTSVSAMLSGPNAQPTMIGRNQDLGQNEGAAKTDSGIDNNGALLKPKSTSSTKPATLPSTAPSTPDTRPSNDPDLGDAQYQGAQDLQVEWKPQAPSPTLQMTWHLLPDEPVQKIFVETSLADPNHFSAIATLPPGTQVYESASTRLGVGKSIFVRISTSSTPTASGETKFSHSNIVEVKTISQPAPTLNPVTYTTPQGTTNQQLNFSWSLPPDVPDSATMIIEGDFNQRGFQPLKRLPAKSLQYSWQLDEGVWLSTHCIQNPIHGHLHGSGCTIQNFRIHYETNEGVVSGYSNFLREPIKGLDQNDFCTAKSGNYQKWRRWDLDGDGVVGMKDWKLFNDLQYIATPSPPPGNCN